MNRDMQKKEVVIDCHAVTLVGTLTIPLNASSIILFSHGTGSSRQSVRNKFVAEEMNKCGFATLTLDLLTPEEDELVRHVRFDIKLLSDRLCCAVDWLSSNSDTARLAIGLFGASTGSAAAINCAAERAEQVLALVSRGGRPDLANAALPKVKCPTLFIVGGFDPTLMQVNEKAIHRMKCHREIEIIPGATHLFSEPGRLQRVASLASWWFARHCSYLDIGNSKNYQMPNGMNAPMGTMRKF